MTIIALGVLILGLVFLIIGRRGRRVGSHPVCRRCSFDLRGKPESSSRCAECGADLTAPRAIAFGQKQPRRPILWTGAVLASVAFIGLALIAYQRYQRLDVYHYLPWAYLEPRLWSSPPDSRAEREIVDRLKADNVTTPQRNALLEKLLDVFADDARTWRPAHEEMLLESAHKHGLTPKQIERLTEAMWPLTFETKRRIVPYEPHVPNEVNIAVDYRHTARRFFLVYDRGSATIRFGGAPLEIKCTATRATFGDRPLKLPLFERTISNVWVRSAVYHEFDNIKPGKYPLIVDLLYEVQLGANIAAPPSANRSTRFTRTIARDIEVLPVGAVPDELVTDASLEPRVHAAFQNLFIERDGKDLVIGFQMATPPVDLAMQIDIVQDNEVVNTVALEFLINKPEHAGWYIYRANYSGVDLTKPIALQFTYAPFATPTFTAMPATGASPSSSRSRPSGLSITHGSSSKTNPSGLQSKKQWPIPSNAIPTCTSTSVSTSHLAPFASAYTSATRTNSSAPA